MVTKKRTHEEQGGSPAKKAKIPTPPPPPKPKAAVKSKPAPKTPAISKGDFMKNAKQLTALVDKKALKLTPKEFSSGGFGWTSSGKGTAEVDGHKLQLQITINVSVVGSKA